MEVKMMTLVTVGLLDSHFKYIMTINLWEYGS